MQHLRAGDPGPLWIVARSQTGGRGRQGRVWASPPGNLYASLALRLAIAPAVAPQLGFVAGVALAQVLRACLGGDLRLQIKWPNDMVFAGAKLAGLLLESAPRGEGEVACVIGFGLNCQSHPDGLAYPATDLSRLGHPMPDPDDLLQALAASMSRALVLWDEGRNFDMIRAAWLAHAVDLGTPLAVVLADRRLAGTFQGVDLVGRLLINTDTGRAVVEAGDVFFPDMIRDCSLANG